MRGSGRARSQTWLRQEVVGATLLNLNRPQISAIAASSAMTGSNPGLAKREDTLRTLFETCCAAPTKVPRSEMKDLVRGLAALCEGGLGSGPLAIADALRLPVLRHPNDASNDVRAALTIARDALSEDGIDDDATACALALELLASQAQRDALPVWTQRLIADQFSGSGTHEVAR